MAADGSSARGGVAHALGGGRWVRVLPIGMAAGLFSTLFGVGGGIVMVPLLILLLSYDARVAAATSLAAIIFTSVVGTIAHGALGNVHWDKALLLGIPAVAGVVVGQTINRRVSNRVITIAFAIFLVGIAARVAVGG